MCDCGSLNPCGCNSTVTLPYLTGAAGSNGSFGGFSAKWKFDAASTTSNPSASYVRFNSATYSSVNEIYISDTNYDGASRDDFLDEFDNGYIYIFKEFDPSKYWYGIVTNETDNGGYHTITVTHLQSNNASFSTDDAIVVSYVNNGDPGSDALTKSYTKESFIGNNTYYEQRATAGTFGTDLTTAADELSTNGDELIANIVLRTPGTSDDTIRLVVGGQPLTSFKVYGPRIQIHSSFVKQSATQLYYEFYVFDGLNGTTQYTKHFDGFVTISDMTANPFDLEVEITTLNSATMDLYKLHSKYSLI